MWCVIPAAGRGSRMGPAAADLPKALLNAGGRPLLAWLLAGLGAAVTDVCVIIPTRFPTGRPNFGRPWRLTWGACASSSRSSPSRAAWAMACFGRARSSAGHSWS